MKTRIYKDAINDVKLFPPSTYTIKDIYDIILKNVDIPKSDLNYRRDCNFELWKNYIHSVMNNSSR